MDNNENEENGNRGYSDIGGRINYQGTSMID
jgi:hypothetical protein